MARFTAGLLKTSMTTLYRHEKELLKQYMEMMDNGNITQQIIDLMPSLPLNGRIYLMNGQYRKDRKRTCKKRE